MQVADVCDLVDGAISKLVRSAVTRATANATATKCVGVTEDVVIAAAAALLLTVCLPSSTARAGSYEYGGFPDGFGCFQADECGAGECVSRLPERIGTLRTIETSHHPEFESTSEFATPTESPSLLQ